MKVTTMQIGEIRPTQLYISENKYQQHVQSFSLGGSAALEPVPVKRIGDDLFFTDGHTRALVLWQNGFREIRTFPDTDPMDWIMYLVDLQWCAADEINAIADLSDRIIIESEYQKKWIDRCSEKHDRLSVDPTADLITYTESDPAKKESICKQIIESLPEWFDLPNINEHLWKSASVLPMICASMYDKVIGYASLKNHYDCNCEIYSLGIFPEFHRQGIGKQIIKEIERYSMKNNLRYLTVKTLAERSKNQSYSSTRAFYRQVGMQKLEEFESLWKEPCAYMIKVLDR